MVNKKQIALLVSASYTKNVLDSKKVEKISQLLYREDLKKYVRGLKLAEKKRTISLVLPNKTLYNKTLVKTNKRVVVTEDKSLLMGAKVIDNDMVYDLSLKSSLDEFVQSL